MERLSLILWNKEIDGLLLKRVRRKSVDVKESYEVPVNLAFAVNEVTLLLTVVIMMI